jgi:hypothetical protein
MLYDPKQKNISEDGAKITSDRSHVVDTCNISGIFFYALTFPVLCMTSQMCYTSDQTMFRASTNYTIFNFLEIPGH